MESIRETQKKYGSRVMIIAVIAGLLFILLGYKPIGKGLVLGAVFSVVNFVLIGEMLPSRLVSSKRKTVMLSIGSIIGRYIMLAVPLVVAVKFPEFDLVAAIVGIFMIQFVIVGEHFSKYFLLTRNKTM